MWGWKRKSRKFCTFKASAIAAAPWSPIGLISYGSPARLMDVTDLFSCQVYTPHKVSECVLSEVTGGVAGVVWLEEDPRR